MLLEGVGATLKAGSEILAFLNKKREGQLDKNYGAANDRVVDALRQVYFTPNGMRQILILLAAGERPSEQQVAEILVHFNDAEWDVARHLHSLEFDEVVGRRELTLKAAEQLEQIRWGKINVRKQIQHALNEPLTKGQPIDPALARQLLGQVDELNALILELEEAHNYRARGR